MNKSAALRRLFNPSSIAVIGGNSAEAVVGQCRRMDYQGEIWAVNPVRREIAGIQCFARVADLPGIPDASFVAVPPLVTIDTVAELSSLGAAGAVCFASGYAEVGDEGRRLQDNLNAAAGDMAIVGPNCHGFLNFFDGVALWPDQFGGQRAESGIGIILQSGNIGINLTMQQRGLDVGMVVSIGNSCNVSLHDYIDTLLADSRITAIGLHIEAIDDIAAFSRAAIRALQKKIPIVAIKTGRSKKGAAITLSHTASLSGSDRLYSSLFNRLGIARCDTLEQFLETLKFVSIVGALPECSVASLSCSGGEASIVADCAQRLRVNLPAFSDDSKTELQEILGPTVSVANPLDYHMYVWGDEQKLRECFSSVMSNDLACTLLILDYPNAADLDTKGWEAAERALVDAVASTGRCAVIVSTLPETLPHKVRERLKTNGIAPMQGLENCLYAVSRAAIIGAARERDRESLHLLPVGSTSGDPMLLDERSSKEMLSRFGVCIPDGQICSADGAPDVAKKLGYPVVVKGVAENIAHKSELDGVALNLADSDAVMNAVCRMQDRFDRFLVERYANGAIAELIVGVNRDPDFGLSLLIGSGGVFAELVNDTITLFLPVSSDDVVAAVKSLKVSKLLHGYRGQPAADPTKVIDAILSISAFAVANCETLVEMDVNPLVVTPGDVVAVDALIRMTPKAEN